MEIFSKLIAFFAVQKERLGILGVGLLGNQALVYGFNWVVYPFVIWKLELVKGFAVMVVLSFCLCYGLLRFYNWSQKDWLGLETIKCLKDYEGSRTTGRIASWILRRSEPVIVVFLSIMFDPFITTVYMRKKTDAFKEMTSRDWKIFLTSLIIGDTYWAIAVFTGISAFEHLFGLFK